MTLSEVFVMVRQFAVANKLQLFSCSDRSIRWAGPPTAWNGSEQTVLRMQFYDGLDHCGYGYVQVRLLRLLGEDQTVTVCSGERAASMSIFFFQYEGEDDLYTISRWGEAAIRVSPEYILEQFGSVMSFCEPNERLASV